MSKIEESGTRLSVTLGMPSFNGTVAVFDKATGRADIIVTNFFFKGKKDIALSEIAAVELVSLQSSAFPRIVLRSGKRIALPSAGKTDAQKAVPVMRTFLGL